MNIADRHAAIRRKIMVGGRTPSRFFSAMATAALIVIFCPRVAMAAEAPHSASPADLRRYLFLAEAAKASYDETSPDVQTTPSGCAALVREDSEGDLIIAFRGSMLTDRSRKGPFSTFGGATMRRNYRDWAATNIKQAAGFLPRQYNEAAAMVERLAQAHPVDKRVYVTGHSKGGGVAAYAAVAACLSEKVDAEHSRRLRVVTFNAAVVRKRNWRRLFRRYAKQQVEDVLRHLAESRMICAVTMRDDPVSRFAADERAPFEHTVVITPTNESASFEQHGIDAIIVELTALLEIPPGTVREK